MTAENMRDSLAGRTLGRFEIVRELGRGAMGIVYEARDPAIGRRVAIKTVKAHQTMGEPGEIMERFRREASAAGTLSHQNIVTVYDVGEQDGVVYIAMEFLEGQPLDEILEERRCLPIKECVEIVAQVLDGLGHAHEHGVVHRDVKPANIVVNDNGNAKVADFGIAHTFDSTLTRTGTLIGTPNYMSPEQFAAGHIDGRSDLFSAAVILYELLTGERAFHGDNLSTMMHNVMNSEPVPVSKVNLHVPEPLAAVLEKAISKKPLSRYQTAAEFAAALRESVKESPDPAILKSDIRETDGIQKTVLSPSEVIATVSGARRAEGTVIGTPPPTAESPSPEAVPYRQPSGLVKLLVVCLVVAGLATAGWLYLQSSKHVDTGSADMTVVEPGIGKPNPDPVRLKLVTEAVDLNTSRRTVIEGVTVHISGGGFGSEDRIIGITTMYGAQLIPVIVKGGQYTLEFTHPKFDDNPMVVDLEPGNLFELTGAKAVPMLPITVE